MSQAAQHLTDGVPFGQLGLSRTSTRTRRYILLAITGTVPFAMGKALVCPAFAEVGERFQVGGVDVALLPIGAYYPCTMWSNLHCSSADVPCSCTRRNRSL
ncbi:hypothetical protein BGW80DRAFT_519059 [Lactifluus volemus]|nr:hypothetical protein BGW80DRAFT_519059 [Lactifluus volemus]